MAFVCTANVLIPVSSDKVGKILISVKDALLASGRWRLIGSGDGKTAFQLRGQTAGVAGSYDVFTASPQWALVGTTYNAWPNSFSNNNAWFILEEIASARVALFQRAVGGNGDTLIAKIGTAVAVTGASATVAPAFVGPSGTLLNSGSLGTATELGVASTLEHWLQIGADNSVNAGNNVSPWFFSVWSKTNNAPVSGGFWLPLIETDPGVTVPVVTAIGPWGGVFGTPGNADGGLVGAGSVWRAGTSWDAASIAYLTCTGVGASPPQYQQLGTDGKWRTYKPLIAYPAIGNRHVGKVDLVYLNKVSRNYPATYDLSGAQPRITLGHLLFPWTNVAPLTSP
jgi:hypothetical protein